MTKRDEIKSRIQITFEGMMVLFLKDGSTYCDVGLLKNAPGHLANLLITEIPKVGAPKTRLHLHDVEIEPRLWLDVHKAQPRVSVYTNTNEKFDRKKDLGDEQDCRWVIHFQSSEMYNSNIATDPNGFKSFLRINDGTLYTQEKSNNNLVVLKPGEPKKVIGKVAVRLRFEIELLDSDVAKFSNGTNGTEIELSAQANVEYGIYFSHIRHDHVGGHSGGGSSEIDAENYNTVVATDRPPSRRIHFDRDGMRATPDAVCFPPTSNPPGF